MAKWNWWNTFLFVAKYLCTNKICKTDSSYIENTDWGLYDTTTGTKQSCAATCLDDDDCAVFEWSDTLDKEICKWWKKEVCQYEKDTKSEDPKFVSCKKLGTMGID